MNTIKNDTLDAMIVLSAHVLAEKNEADLISKDTANVEIPRSVDRKVRRMIRKERRKIEYGAWYMCAKRVAVARVATVFLVVCTVAFASAISVSAVREALWSAIVQFYEEYISVGYVADTEPPAYIEVKKEPSAIPDDWTCEILLDSQSMYYIQYSSNGEEIVSFKQKVLDKSKDWIDNSNSTIEIITIQGYEGNLITLLDKGLAYLVWSDGCYSYTIEYDHAKIDCDLVIAIAESLQ